MPEVVLPIGPYHPALTEPEFFQVYVSGEEIVDAKVRIGYNHRGIEWLAQRKTIHQVPFLVERICGICSNAHPMCFCQSVEEAGDIVVPDRARHIRTLIAELERIHSHLLWAGIASHLIGYDTLFMYFWRHREPICELLDLITGNRQHYAINCIGGVRRDIDLEKYGSKILGVLKSLTPAVLRLGDAVVKDRVVKARMEGVGILSTDNARKYCVVGPTARGSGIGIDVRKNEPYAAYRDVGVDVKVFTECDVMARTLVRVHETLESAEIVRRTMDAMPNGPIKAELNGFPTGEGVGKVEAPRGEDIHYVRLNGTDKPERLKIRAPTYMNLGSIVPQLVGYTIADAPLIIGAVDPCMCCTDRIALVDVRKGRKLVLSLGELAQKTRKNRNPIR